MKKRWIVFAALFLLLTGCGKAEVHQAETVQPKETDQTQAVETEDTTEQTDTVKAENGENTDAEEPAAAGEGVETSDPADAGTLPPYKYTGSDPYLAAIIDYQLTEIAPMYAPAQVFIPEPHVLLEDEADPADIKVIGNFWIMGYDLEGTTLMTQCGGEMPAVFHFEKAEDGSVRLKEQDFVEVAGDGAQYAKDIKRFCEGYEGLEEQFYQTGNGKDDGNTDLRIEYIRQYVSENHLDITAFQDFGWDPVSIE
ncbi:MAG: hypothetical protein K6E16_09480 [Lachnospiraceae bacterium]|nr:hypothetical protein [Lachnospiraceae bacterium]